jgi:hypothetical protein
MIVDADADAGVVVVVCVVADMVAYAVYFDSYNG